MDEEVIETSETEETETQTNTEQTETEEDTQPAIEDVLIGLLESFVYPVYRQGSLTVENGYPDSFFTFWNYDSPDHSHYDNHEYGTDWNFGVYFYSNNPELTYSVLADARILLKQNNWIVPSKGFDVRSDLPSHTGRGLTVFYLEV